MFVVDLFRFLKGRMASDSVITSVVDDRIYEGQAPQSAAYPFVLFSLLSGPHTLGNGARRVFSRPLVEIVIVGEGGDVTALDAVAKRIDALFGERARGEVGSLVIAGSHGESVAFPSAPETDEGTIYKRLGGQYRFFVHKKA